MKLNHLNLTVTDVAATRDFLEKYFGLRGHGKNNDRLTFVFDENGMVITLMKGEAVAYPDSFHVGFIQESEARVNEINARLREDGYDVAAPSKQHGSWTFYLRSPGGFLIEVLA